MMIKLCRGLMGLALVYGSALAMNDDEIGKIVLQDYPGARIIEIARETYKGESIYQVDFKHGGEVLQAILSLDGDFIKVKTRK